MILELTIVFLVYAAFMRLLEIPYSRKLSASKTAKEAIEIRRKMIVFRRRLTRFSGIVSLIFVLLLAIGIYAIFKDGTMSSDPNYLWQSLLLLILVLLFFVWIRPFSKLSGHLSIYDKETFLKEHPCYTLYLRGFCTDEYANVYESILNESPNLLSSLFSFFRKKIKKHTFFEQEFMVRLSQMGVPTVSAIGNPKEKDTPKGALRLYLENETWESDICDLMDRASLIIILVNDSPSCLYEIEKALERKSKSIFIVNDLDRYRQACRTTELPLLPQAENCLFHYLESSPVFKVYENSHYGCFDLATELAGVYEEYMK